MIPKVLITHTQLNPIPEKNPLTPCPPHLLVLCFSILQVDHMSTSSKGWWQVSEGSDYQQAIEQLGVGYIAQYDLT